MGKSLRPATFSISSQSFYQIKLPQGKKKYLQRWSLESYPNYLKKFDRFLYFNLRTNACFHILLQITVISYVQGQYFEVLKGHVTAPYSDNKINSEIIIIFNYMTQTPDYIIHKGNTKTRVTKGAIAPFTFGRGLWRGLDELLLCNYIFQFTLCGLEVGGHCWASYQYHAKLRLHICPSCVLISHSVQTII